MKPSNDDIPLLYGSPGSDDAAPMVTPSEEEMARHLAAQMNAQMKARPASRQAPHDGTQAHADAGAGSDVAADTQATSQASTRATGPALSAERTAALAALDEATRASGQARDFDETTLLLVRTEARPAPRAHDDFAIELPAVPPVREALANAAATAAVSPPPGRAPAEAPVRQLGRYQVHQRLGRGGMATVYRAHDPKAGRDVAIKFLHASMREDPDSRARFLREAGAAGGLSHPNIVAVYEVDEAECRPFMAMELVSGMPLSAKLEQAGPLPLRQVVLIGLQLARALDYAHARGVVHRDIKPGNIMLLDDGQSIKVTDFGIAHMPGAPGERAHRNTVLGTPQYMSPEQTRGEDVDGRSDLFSAGVVLYQMLAGERPFRADNLVALAARIATEEPPPLIRSRPDVPASLRRVVERCLAKTPAQRWQTGQELADALLRVLSEIEDSEREQRQPRQFSLRLKWAAATALLASLLMGLLVSVAAQRQSSVLLDQASDFGNALARLLAAQQADQVLAEEWSSVETQVQTLMATRSVQHIAVVDGSGVVRASSEPALVGKPYSADTQRALSFEAPVLLQGKTLGRVALRLDDAPLAQVARQSLWLWTGLAASVVAALTLAMFLLASRFVGLLRRAEEALTEIGKGRLDHRIDAARSDEVGRLYASADAMAQALQRRSEGPDAGRKPG